MKKQLLQFLFLVVVPLITNAQWATSFPNTTTSDNIGIGTTSPNALLHVHSSATSPAVDVFARFTNSTTGSSGSVGALVGVDANGNAGLSALSGDVLITTPSSGYGIKAKGTKVGMGRISTFTPQSALHLYPDDYEYEYVQIADLGCGSGAGDGLKVGVNSQTGTTYAELRMQEDAAMTFFTGNTEYMRIMSSTNHGNVGISTTSPTAKLHVNNTTEAIGILGKTTVNTGLNRGVMGTVSTTSALVNIGVEGGQTVSGNAFNVGVWGKACGSNLFNYGGYFDAGCKQCGTGTVNYGIYATGTGVPITGGACLPVAGYFNGAAVSTVGFFPSDKQFKDSLVNLGSALATLAKLTPTRFVFKTSSFPSIKFPTGRQYGILAQQIDTVIPELVSKMIHPQERDSTGTLIYDSIQYKAVNYIGLIPWTIRAIKELDSLKIGATTTKADSNYVVKWSTTDKTLVNSLIYADASKVGIPTTSSNVYVNVVNTGNSITAGKFEGGSKGLYGVCSGTNALQYGVLGECRSATSMNVGVRGDAKRSTTAYNTGLQGYADSSSTANVGVAASTIYNNNTSLNIGIYGDAKNSRYQNMGGQFIATDTFGLNYGVYGKATSPTAGSHAYAGYFNGDVTATGTVTWVSDIRFKNNIQDLGSENALATVLRLEPKRYVFNTTDYPYMCLPKGKQYGLLAQDVEQVLPELVSDNVQPEIKDMEGNQVSPQLQYKGLNYTGLIPLLVGAVKQQQAKIDSLTDVINTRLADIETRLNSCCGTGGGHRSLQNEEGEHAGSINHVSVELNAMKVVVLEQNAPNPFAEQTSISYFVPESEEPTQIVFSDMLGTVIKTVDVTSGYGVMTVFASNLSTGQYSYSLLIGGKTVETKRMIKSK